MRKVTALTKKTEWADLPIPQFIFNSDSQALTALDREHKYIINLGGKGSGKTATIRTWAADRGQWDTAFRHGIFTNTQDQLDNAVLPELFTAFPRGVLSDYGHKPPKEWVREWIRAGIEIPHVPNYRKYFYTRGGLHTQCGTLSKQSYKQYESIEYASLRIEEVPNIPPEALNMILTRLRCGKGDMCETELGHRHQAWLFGNPPVGIHPWLADWLDKIEEGATKLYHAMEDGERCDGCFHVTYTGKRVKRQHGPILNHRQWPLMRRGVGPAIYIRSRTSDNRKNLREGYEDDIAISSDHATAMAWLEGEFSREIGSGCYYAFSDQNVREVKYDPTRTLFVCADINTEPRIAVLAHPLVAGEYPSAWHVDGIEQVGVFGEFFHLGGMSDEVFAEAMVTGNRGTGDAGYTDQKLRGLPANWGGLANHQGRILIYGDRAGNSKSVHARNCESSWELIRNTLDKMGMKGRYTIAVPPGTNPAARKRIASVNAKLRSHVGKPSLSIAPRCRHVIKDCEAVVWNEDGLAEREWRQGAEMLRTHCMAGLGYCIVMRYPLGRDIDRDPSNGLPTIGGSTIQIPRTRL